MFQEVGLLLAHAYASRHEKTNKISVRPCAQLVAKDPSFLHADSEDSDQTGQMTRLI